VQPRATIAKADTADQAARSSSVRTALGSGADIDRFRADLRALAGDDWLIRLVSRVQSDLVRLATGSETTTGAAGLSRAQAVIGSDFPSRSLDLTDPDLARRSRTTAKADIESAVGVIVVVAVVRRFSLPLQEKWRRRRRSAGWGRRPARAFFRRPHALAGDRLSTRDRMARL
jgi:hypothetical protein